MNDSIKFIIEGEPCGKGRPRFRRCGPYVQTYTPQKTACYEELVQLCFFEQIQSKRNVIHRFDDKDMLKLEINAYFGIAKSVSKKKRLFILASKLRPIKKPDVDNILKIIADSLNKVAYKDDAQIVECIIRKFYSENPRVEVTISKV